MARLYVFQTFLAKGDSKSVPWTPLSPGGRNPPRKDLLSLRIPLEGSAALQNSCPKACRPWNHAQPSAGWMPPEPCRSELAFVVGVIVARLLQKSVLRTQRSGAATIKAYTTQSFAEELNLPPQEIPENHRKSMKTTEYIGFCLPRRL